MLYLHWRRCMLPWALITFTLRDPSSPGAKFFAGKGYAASSAGDETGEKVYTMAIQVIFFLHRTESLLFNYCHISNHIQNKSQNDNVQIKAPQKMKALVHCNSVTCHSQSAPWFTKHFLITLPHSMQTSQQPWLLSWLLTLLSCLYTGKTQGWDTASESAMTGDGWLLLQVHWRPSQLMVSWPECLLGTKPDIHNLILYLYCH